MSEGHPRVSGGVPVFNGESFLAKTLDSLLNQTFPTLKSLFRTTPPQIEQKRFAGHTSLAIRACAITGKPSTGEPPGTTIAFLS